MDGCLSVCGVFGGGLEPRVKFVLCLRVRLKTELMDFRFAGGSILSRYNERPVSLRYR